MKKLLLLMIALVCVPVLKANPIPAPAPDIRLSEIAFDSNGNWVIELQYYNTYNSDYEVSFDSIFISSSSGISKLKRYKTALGGGIMMVRNDSLQSNLTINPVNDSIQVKFFINPYPHTTVLTTPLVYGNFVTATLRTPKADQSMAVYEAPGLYSFYNYKRYTTDVYSIDKSPTIGLENDTTGMMGTLHGKIYDTNNQLLTASDITYYGIGFYDIIPKTDGTYSTRIFSYKHNINLIYYNSVGNKFILDIAPINVSVQPDSVVTADIHILKITGINELKSDPEQVIRVFPNPITELSFKYEISIPVKSANSYIELINMAGQQVARYPITEDKGKIDLPAHTANGTYTLRLFVNNKNYGASKIVIYHE